MEATELGEGLSGGEDVLKQLEKNSLRRLALERSECTRQPERERRGGIEELFLRNFLRVDHTFQILIHMH